MSVNQLSIYGAVSALCEEYSSCQTRTGKLVVAEQSDPLFAPADLFINDTRTLDWNSCTKKIFCRSTKNEWKSFPQPDQLLKNCIDAGFLQTVEVGQYFMTDHTDEFLTICRSQWHVVSIRYQETTNQLTRKVGFKGTSKFDPCWKSQPVTCKVNMEWKLELNL